MAKIEIKDLYKTYDNKKNILKKINLKIDHGEFVVLLGPSGCGKTTLLNLIAGLIDITEGDIFIDDLKVNNNLAFALKIKKVKKDVISAKVNSVAKLLKIEEYLKKKPGELSGGQKQRVAIGKAIVQNPSVFLMDEPLSSLDANLRREMCEELTELHKKF